MANVDIKLGYKDSAWFTANATLILKVGQIVYLEQTGTYKIGDGTTQLSALTFLGGSGSVDVNTIGAAINGATSATPNDTDLVMSVESSVAKKNTWTQIKAFLKTYFDTVYTTTSAVSTQITTALSGYATQAWVTSQGYITNVVTALGYTPEDISNKTSTVTGNETSTVKYLTVKGVYDWATGLFVKKGTLTTNTIPKATASDTIGDSLITDDGTNVYVNGLRIRNISNGTYFNASGVNGHFWNSFNDGINLFRVKNDGVLNIPQGTGDRIMALDANKDVVYLDTATYPSLPELTYVKGITSALQTQLNAKASNLIAKINTAIAHTGTTSETILNSSTPISGFEANDFIKFQASIFANNTANNKTLRIYVNTSHSLSGATLLASCTITNQTGGVSFIRNLWFKNSLSAQGVFTVSTSLTTDETLASSTGDTSLTYNFSGTNYLIIAGVLPTSAADTLTIKWFRAQIIR